MTDSRHAPLPYAYQLYSRIIALALRSAAARGRQESPCLNQAPCLLHLGDNLRL